MSNRDYISLRTQLAAALLQIPVDQGDGTMGPIMSHEEAKQVSAGEIISLWHRDHYPVRKEDGGPDAHYNLAFRPIVSHRRKTAAEATERARVRDITEREEEFRRRCLAKIGQDEPETVGELAKRIVARTKRARLRRKWRMGSRPFPKRAREQPRGSP